MHSGFRGKPSFSIRPGRFPNLRSFQSESLGESFEGAVLNRAPETRSGLVLKSPVLGMAMEVLNPRRGFLEGLSRAYGTPMDGYAAQLVVVHGMVIRGRFLTETRHRERALGRLCANLLDSPCLLLIHPPSTHWRPADAAARFRLEHMRSKDLMMCLMMGRLGFAQLCDDLLRRPVPLLLRPWCPQRGLLRPTTLPAKSYSQMLCVDRIARRRLLLFDKRAAAPGLPQQP